MLRLSGFMIGIAQPLLDAILAEISELRNQFQERLARIEGKLRQLLA